MTLAARIRKMHSESPNLPLEDIATILGTSPAYCRVVLRQRHLSGISEADRKYRESPKWKAICEAQLKAKKQLWRVLKDTRESSSVRKAARDAYHAARLNGHTKKEADRIAWSTYRDATRHTGNVELAKSEASKVYQQEMAKHDN